jgi:hypothetical protein
MSTQALATDRRVGGSNLLRFALRLDAAVSGVFGVVLVVAAPLASEALGISTTALLAVGLVCLAYAAALVRIQSRRLGPGAGWLVVALNIGWAVASVLLVVGGWLPLTGIGTAAVLAQAIVVGVLAELQFTGVRRLTA